MNLFAQAAIKRLTRRAESPMSEELAERFLADVARGRHLYALCGEYPATIREVLDARRELCGCEGIAEIKRKARRPR